MKLPPEAISPYLIPQSNQESFTTSVSTNSGHSVHQANVGEVPGAVVSRCSNVKPKLFDHFFGLGGHRFLGRLPQFSAAGL